MIFFTLVTFFIGASAKSGVKIYICLQICIEEGTEHTRELSLACDLLSGRDGCGVVWHFC